MTDSGMKEKVRRHDGISDGYEGVDKGRLILYDAFAPDRMEISWTHCRQNRLLMRSSRSMETAMFILWLAALMIVRVASNAASSTTFLRAQANPKQNFKGPGAIALPTTYKGDNWRCRACVDVAQTWRETSACVGATDPLRQAREINDAQGCGFTSHCDMYETAEKQEACIEMKSDFRQDYSTMRVIYDGIKAKESMYDICKNLGKCLDQSSAEGSKCAQALNTHDCVDDPFCTKRHDCSNSCYMCFWVVKTFPLFQEECYKGVSNGGIPPPRPKPQMQLPSAGGRRRLLQEEGLGSPKFSPAPQNAANPAVLSDYCFKLWDDVEASVKNRYLISYKSQLGGTDWSAQTVCQCMKLCPYDSREALDLLSMCARDELNNNKNMEAIKRSLFPDLARGEAEMSRQPRYTGAEVEEKGTVREWWNAGMGRR